MKLNGTIVNYYFHCRRQCYLFGHRLNLEDNSEIVKIGRAIHENKKDKYRDSEVAIENVRIDKITKEYVTEIKKSDADINAAKWQLLYYLYVLKEKGIYRKGRLEFVEKNKSKNKVVYIELNKENEAELKEYMEDIQKLLKLEYVPEVLNKPSCKKCAYYEYCYI